MSCLISNIQQYPIFFNPMSDFWFNDKGSNDTGSNDKGSNDKGQKRDSGSNDIGSKNATKGHIFFILTSVTVSISLSLFRVR